MPFQGRCLMMFLLRAVHRNGILADVGAVLRASHFWFPRPVSPEVMIQALVDVLSVAVTGVMATKLYQASSRRKLLTVLVYPFVLVACCATYVLHTVQNFRFVYDLPSMAFFSVALYLIYTRKPLIYFSLLFIVATVNRETTLLLLPLLLLDTLVLRRGKENDKESSSRWTLLLVVVLALFWVAWQIAMRYVFASNVSEFYPRIDWNVKSLFAPQAWPQMLSACGYLLIIVVIWFRKIPDARLRGWLWLIPLWMLFMFSFGILIETRIFGELIPLIVCSATLILEEELTKRWLSSTLQHAQRGDVDVHVRAA